MVRREIEQGKERDRLVEGIDRASFPLLRVLDRVRGQEDVSAYSLLREAREKNLNLAEEIPKICKEMMSGGAPPSDVMGLIADLHQRCAYELKEMEKNDRERSKTEGSNPNESD